MARKRNPRYPFLNAWMRYRGFTQSDLALKLRKQPHTVSRWCAQIRSPGPPLIGTLCKILNVSEHQLLHVDPYEIETGVDRRVTKRARAQEQQDESADTQANGDGPEPRFPYRAMAVAELAELFVLVHQVDKRLTELVQAQSRVERRLGAVERQHAVILAALRRSTTTGGAEEAAPKRHPKERAPGPSLGSLTNSE